MKISLGIDDDNIAAREMVADGATMDANGGDQRWTIGDIQREKNREWLAILAEYLGSIGRIGCR